MMRKKNKTDLNGQFRKYIRSFILGMINDLQELNAHFHLVLMSYRTNFKLKNPSHVSSGKERKVTLFKCLVVLALEH